MALREIDAFAARAHPSATSVGELPIERDEARFRELCAEHQPAVARVCRANEADRDKQRDLEQEIWVAVWRALPSFEGRSSLRTWLYRVAHNVAATHAARAMRERGATSALAALEDVPDEADAEEALDQRTMLERVAAFVRTLRPLDRQVMLLFLEGLDPQEIADVTGLSATNVTTKVHRTRALLARRFQPRGDRHGR